MTQGKCFGCPADAVYEVSYKCTRCGNFSSINVCEDHMRDPGPVFQYTCKHQNELIATYVLDELEEFLEDQEDVNYEGTGPNEAMSLLMSLRQERGKI